MAARPDENVAQVYVEPVMPLFLQLVSKQADIGTVVKLLASQWHAVTATVKGMTCKPVYMCGWASQHLGADTEVLKCVCTS